MRKISKNIQRHEKIPQSIAEAITQDHINAYFPSLDTKLGLYKTFWCIIGAIQKCNIYVFATSMKDVDRSEFVQT